MSVEMLVGVPWGGCGVLVVEVTVVHELFVRPRLEEGSAPAVCCVIFKPIPLPINVGVRDLPGALQFVRVCAPVARALGHLQLPTRRTAVLVAPAVDENFQAGSASIKWLKNGCRGEGHLGGSLELKSIQLRWRSGLHCDDDDVEHSQGAPPYSTTLAP